MPISSANVLGIHPTGSTELLGVLGTLYQYAKTDQLNREKILAGEVDRQVRDLYNGDLAAFAQANPALYEKWRTTFRMPEDPGPISPEGQYALDRRKAMEDIRAGVYPVVPSTPSPPPPGKEENQQGNSSEKKNVGQKEPFTPVPPGPPAPSPPPSPLSFSTEVKPVVDENSVLADILQGKTDLERGINQYFGTVKGEGDSEATYPVVLENLVRYDVGNRLLTEFNKVYGPAWMQDPNRLREFAARNQRILDIALHSLYQVLGTRKREEMKNAFPVPEPPRDIEAERRVQRFQADQRAKQQPFTPQEGSIVKTIQSQTNPWDATRLGIFNTQESPRYNVAPRQQVPQDFALTPEVFFKQVGKTPADYINKNGLNRVALIRDVTQVVDALYGVGADVPMAQPWKQQAINDLVEQIIQGYRTQGGIPWPK